MWACYHKGGKKREPRPWRPQCWTRFAVAQKKKDKRQCEHDHKIFGPKRHSDRQAEQDPVEVSTATQRGVKCKAGERPERQLDDIVIELDGREIEVLHSVDDKNRKERAEGPVIAQASKA